MIGSVREKEGEERQLWRGRHDCNANEIWATKKESATGRHDYIGGYLSRLGA